MPVELSRESGPAHAGELEQFRQLHDDVAHRTANGFLLLVTASKREGTLRQWAHIILWGRRQGGGEGKKACQPWQTGEGVDSFHALADDLGRVAPQMETQERILLQRAQLGGLTRIPDAMPRRILH